MSLRQITSLTSIGAALEYYDFVIYATLSHYLSLLFFPASDYQVSLLKAFAIFGIGYLVRPLGGVIMGTFGDRFGRKNVFILSISLMAGATFAIGLLPTYQQIGVTAPILLILCRIIQGISFGAELPGAITFIAEHAHRQNPGRHIAWMVFGVSLGSLFSSALYTFLTYWFSDVAMQDYAWRIPFIIGGCLGIAGYLLRKNTQETPLFNNDNAFKLTTPLLKELFSQHWRQIILGIIATLYGGSLIISYLYLPHYIKHDHISLTSISFAFTIGFVWSAAIIPVCGRITDKLGVTKSFILTMIFTLLFCYPMTLMIQSEQFSQLLIFAILYQTLTSLLAVNYSILLSQLFPTHVRYTGIALCYNVAYALAGFLPIVLASLLFTVT